MEKSVILYPKHRNRQILFNLASYGKDHVLFVCTRNSGQAWVRLCVTQPRPKLGYEMAPVFFKIRESKSKIKAIPWISRDRPTMGSLCEREVNLVQTGLRAFASVSGSDSRASNFVEKWMQVNHWAVDVCFLFLFYNLHSRNVFEPSDLTFTTWMVFNHNTGYRLTTRSHDQIWVTKQRKWDLLCRCHEESHCYWRIQTALCW